MPSQIEWDANHISPASRTINRKWGWSHLWGLATRRPPERLWQERPAQMTAYDHRAGLLDILIASYERDGRWPLAYEWEHATAEHPTRSTVERRFGSWDIAIHEAERKRRHRRRRSPEPTGEHQSTGQSHNPFRQTSRGDSSNCSSNHADAVEGSMYRGRALYSGTWTPDSVIEALLRWRRQNGKVPKSRDLEHADRSLYPSQSRVKQIFGSWNAALEERTLHDAQRQGWEGERTQGLADVLDRRHIAASELQIPPLARRSRSASKAIFRYVAP
jgi:hypothetical protein